MERTDELKERIRQQPLNDRLEGCRRRIGAMCSEGRPPRMCIPVQHDDDDFYISTTLADAQQAVERLEQQVAQLRTWQDGVVKAFVEAPLEWSPDLGVQHIPSSLPQIFKNMKDCADRLIAIQTAHTTLRGLVRELFEFKCSDVPEQFNKDNPMYEQGDEACPFFTEAYLYVLLGKEDARALLAITKPLRDTLPREGGAQS